MDHETEQMVKRYFATATWSDALIMMGSDRTLVGRQTHFSGKLNRALTATLEQELTTGSLIPIPDGHRRMKASIEVTGFAAGDTLVAEVIDIPWKFSKKDI